MEKQISPHIVIFNPDQWRGDVLGHLGNRAAVTPNLDRIVATEAVSFRNTFCQNTVCTPSRCSFMTGWYPHVRGHRTMFHMLRKDEPVLLKILKASGYFVWWGGKNDLVPGQYGYEDYCQLIYQPPVPPRYRDLHNDPTWRGAPDSDTYYSFYRGRLDRQPGDNDLHYLDGDWANVLGALEQIKNRPAGQPLCIYLPLGYPHPPYAVEEPYFSQIDRLALPARTPSPEWDLKPSILHGISERQRLRSWSEMSWTELRATYYGMCARVDAQFGLVVQALQEAGIYNDTAIFFFSDHGDFTGDYGLVEKTQNTFEDCLTRVPFIVKPPENVAVHPGVSQVLVELIDFPATVVELCHLQVDYTHYGRSLLPLLSGQAGAHRDAVFCEGGRLPGERQAKELESQDNQVPSGLYWPRLSLQASDGPEHGKATMCRTARYKYVRRLLETDELYDLETDPQELYNRIHDPALTGVLSEMKDRLLTFYQETCDVVPMDADRRW
jgi:arylsulfatase A-like enzyme